MSERIVIVGCGGFGREVFSILSAGSSQTGSRWEIAGFFDDAPSAANRRRVVELGGAIRGPVDDLRVLASPCAVVVAVGAPEARQQIVQRLSGSGIHFPPVIHPHTSIGAFIRLAAGVVAAPGVRLSTNVEVGEHVQIDQNAVVGHDTIIGDFSRINPQACVSGDVSIGTAVLVGANATILQGLRIGDRAVIGAGACVTRDVPPGATVKGVPAR